MMLVIVAAFIMAAPLFATVYFKRRARWLRAAYTAWGLVEQAAQVLLEDRHLDSRLGDTVERLILSVGDGRLTRDFLIALALHKTRSSSPMTEFDEVFRQLNSEQYHRFFAVYGRGAVL